MCLTQTFLKQRNGTETLTSRPRNVTHLLTACYRVELFYLRSHKNYVVSHWFDRHSEGVIYDRRTSRGHEENNLEEEETVMPPLIKYLNLNKHGIRGYFSNLLQLQQLMFKIIHYDIFVYFLLRYILHNCIMFLPLNEIFSVYLLGKSTVHLWGRILGWSPDKKLKSFRPCYSQSPLQLCLRFLFLQTHATSYSFLMEKGGNPERKTIPLSYGLNPIRETSSLRTFKIMPRNIKLIVRSWIRKTTWKVFAYLGYFLHDCHDLIQPNTGL